MRFSRWVSKTREAVEKLFSTSNDATSIRQSANSRNKDSKALDYRFHYCGVVISTRLFQQLQFILVYTSVKFTKGRFNFGLTGLNGQPNLRHFAGFSSVCLSRSPWRAAWLSRVALASETQQPCHGLWVHPCHQPPPLGPSRNRLLRNPERRPGRRNTCARDGTEP